MMRLMMTMMMDDTQTLRSFFLLYAAIPKCNRREAGPHWVQRPVTEWKSSVHCDWALVQEDVSYLITRTYDCLTKHPGVTLNPIVFVSYIICNCVTAGEWEWMYVFVNNLVSYILQYGYQFPISNRKDRNIMPPVLHYLSSQWGTVLLIVLLLFILIG